MKYKAIPLASLITLFVLVNIYSRHLRAQTPDAAEWKARFLSEAPKGWAKYYARASRLQGLITGTLTRLVPKKQTLERYFLDLKQAPGCAIMITQSELSGGKANPQGELAAVNPKYSFTLKRSKGSSPWAVTEVSKEKTVTYPNLSTIDGLKACIAQPVAINYNLQDDWPSMLASPDFNSLSVVPTKKNDLRLIQVDFEMSWVPSETNLIRVKSGRAWFDPDHCWVMRYCDYKLVRFDGEGKPPAAFSHQSVSYQYEIAPGEFPVLKRSVLHGIDPDGGVKSEDVGDYSLVLRDVPESEFTLSAFNLLEPSDLDVQQPTRWFLWVTLAGIGCLVLGAFFARRKRRTA